MTTINVTDDDQASQPTRWRVTESGNPNGKHYWIFVSQDNWRAARPGDGEWSFKEDSRDATPFVDRDEAEAVARDVRAWENNNAGGNNEKAVVTVEAVP